MSDPTLEQKRAVYCVEEAKRRNLYWAGGGWCDWVTDLLVDLEQAHAERDALKAALIDEYRANFDDLSQYKRDGWSGVDEYVDYCLKTEAGAQHDE